MVRQRTGSSSPRCVDACFQLVGLPRTAEAKRHIQHGFNCINKVLAKFTLVANLPADLKNRAGVETRGSELVEESVS